MKAFPYRYYKKHLRSCQSINFRLARYNIRVHGFSTLFSGAALVFHKVFFPEQSAAMALILAMGTYGAGYIARIIGAIFFGKMGDRVGRKKVLLLLLH